MWKIEITNRAEKDLKKLMRLDAERIRTAIRESIAFNPYDSKKLEGHEAIYSKRIGNLRIIFSIDKLCRQINILKIGKRQNIYENF